VSAYVVIAQGMEILSICHLTDEFEGEGEGAFRVLENIVSFLRYLRLNSSSKIA
jgi:hypothetical protein